MVEYPPLLLEAITMCQRRPTVEVLSIKRSSYKLQGWADTHPQAFQQVKMAEEEGEAEEAKRVMEVHKK